MYIQELKMKIIKGNFVHDILNNLSINKIKNIGRYCYFTFSDDTYLINLDTLLVLRNKEITDLLALVGQVRKCNFAETIYFIDEILNKRMIK